MEAKKDFVFEGDVRVGNYAVGRCYDDVTGWREVVVRSVSGFWEVRFRDDNPMYSLLESLVGDEAMRDALEAVLTCMYVMCHTVGDRGFYEGFAELVERLGDRLVSVSSDGDDEDLSLVGSMRVLDDMLAESEDWNGIVGGRA